MSSGDLAAQLVTLDRLRRDRRILVPLLALAIVIQGVALWKVITADVGWLASLIATPCATVLGILAGLTQRRIERLEDGLGEDS